ncbi:Ras guanine nucleotide exchange factor J [Thecamonas trahens ATCC 50062]|uniref:Ras guanine nucleotide exchange factor J n=1 Tax=Thecamonas trahens ATCC 50062 TaxID=461836 RepID=A0A0L0DL86_THETB|nr:Ras guanine nucleotide exchange factor J [Thecamonas trahens ATCC 50062]KNC52801.1 Ras guanine nucleotide exchange factor J [Thecamonas trahens ATCC 50062]|eukprot:XP_013755110.1 Ras guanine nucleotide exchange factor J [Thecamonas trahens ATCC 50062]
MSVARLAIHSDSSSEGGDLGADDVLYAHFLKFQSTMRAAAGRIIHEAASSMSKPRSDSVYSSAQVLNEVAFWEEMEEVASHDIDEDSVVVREPTSQDLAAASLNQLLRFATDGSDLVDPRRLLHVFRKYCTPRVLLLKVLDLLSPPDDLTNLTTALGALPQPAAALDLLAVWITEFRGDFLDSPSFVTAMQQVCEKRLPELGFEAAAEDLLFKLAATMQQVPLEPLVVAPAGRPTPPKIKLKPGASLSLLDFGSIPPADLARQLTLLDQTLLQRIDPAEFRDLAWSKKKTMHLAPNILEFIAHFNKISNFCAGMILKEKKAKDRSKRITYFAKTCKELLTLRNYNTLMAFNAAFASTPVSRLKKTLDSVSSSTTATLTTIRELFSSQRSFKHLREAMRADPHSPAIPFLGIFLSDLTFAYEANDDFTQVDSLASRPPSSPTSPGHGPRRDRLPNWSKGNLVGRIIAEFCSFQRRRFNITRVEAITDLLRVLLLREIEEDILFDMSYDCEPSARRPSTAIPTADLVAEQLSGTGNQKLSSKQVAEMERIRRYQMSGRRKSMAAMGSSAPAVEHTPLPTTMLSNFQLASVAETAESGDPSLDTSSSSAYSSSSSSSSSASSSCPLSPHSASSAHDPNSSPPRDSPSHVASLAKTPSELHTLRLAEAAAEEEPGAELRALAADLADHVQLILEDDERSAASGRPRRDRRAVRLDSPRHAALHAEAEARAAAAAAAVVASDMVAETFDPKRHSPRHDLPRPEAFGVELLADAQAALVSGQGHMAEPAWAGSGSARWTQDAVALAQRLDALPPVPPDATYPRKLQVYAQRRALLEAALATSITACDHIAVAVRALDIELETKSRANGDLHNEMLALRNKLRRERRHLHSKRAHGALASLVGSLVPADGVPAPTEADLTEHSEAGHGAPHRARRRRRRKHPAAAAHASAHTGGHDRPQFLQRGGGMTAPILPALDMEIAALEHDLFHVTPLYERMHA